MKDYIYLVTWYMWKRYSKNWNEIDMWNV